MPRWNVIELNVPIFRMLLDEKVFENDTTRADACKHLLPYKCRPDVLLQPVGNIPAKNP